MQRFLLILLCLSSLVGWAQNLIPNASFEEYGLCPDALRQIDRASHWYSASNGTPEYLNACGLDLGQTAKDGNGFAGFIAYASYDSDLEYLGVKLDQTLEKGQRYCFSFHLQPDAENPVIINRIGAYFSSDPLKMAFWRLGEIQPQVLLRSVALPGKWTVVSGSFVAKGGESYLQIGNFYGKSGVKSESINRPTKRGWYSYYYLDQMLLVPSEENCSDPSFAVASNRVQIKKKKLLVYFASDEFTLSLGEEKKIEGFIETLKQKEGIQLLVEGHTDSDADYAYNENLSLNRVETVIAKLGTLCSIPLIRQWKGERNLLNASQSEEEKYLNRRVEITVISP